MRRSSSYLLTLLLLAIALLTLGKWKGEALRGKSVGLFSSVWLFVDCLTRGELAREEALLEENRLLKSALKEMADGEASAPPSSLERTRARVIYRPFNDWLSSFWIDIGAESGAGLVGINSPVLYRGALVGLVDTVGKRQSRVLMITDPKLRVAVRVARGDPRRFLVVHQVDHLLELLKKDPVPPELLEALSELKEEYLPEGRRSLLAKGELKGAVSPKATSNRILLKGLGFNFERSDKRGAARDLRRGVPYESPLERASSLIEPYDLLVTSGLDGLLPEGLDVALVTEVYPLDEGDVAYEIEAEPLFGPLEEMREVELLPPLPFNPDDLPPFLPPKRGVR